MPQDVSEEWRSTVLEHRVGLNPQYCSDRHMQLDIRKNWSFSGLDYTVKDQDGKVLLRSHGHREYRTDLIHTNSRQEKIFSISLMFTYRGPGERSGRGSRTYFKDYLTGMNKEIVVDWMDLMKHRGLISLRDDTGHDRTNQEKFGNGAVIGLLNDYDTIFDYTHPQLEFVPNIDYSLLAITAICSESFTG
ncbi:hypothetical protein V866_003247 [Kwoniella sp. B9012]|uniref:Tubby C-terminal domain-containing protein n=1 Tax=Kwoniella europaea PYCC6329 TaxID=1423913 RepID=A0AAX4KFJ4_9TREE